MGKQDTRRARRLDETAFMPGATLAELLPQGHAVHGYSSGDGTRVIKILETPRYSDGAPLLGYGEDGQAEPALARALASYALRDQDGLVHIEPGHYPFSHKDKIGRGGNNSRFDNIVWGGHLTLFQVDRGVIAHSEYGGGPGGMGSFEVVAEDALQAIVALTDEYNFMFNAARLPAIDLGQ